MKKPSRKQTILIVIAILIVVAIVYSFMPAAVPVETATVQSDSLQVTIEEEGKTHVSNSYHLSAPVAASLRRIDLEEGDAVKAGDPLVQLEPPQSAILDPRSRAEAEARVAAAEAALRQAAIKSEQAIRERNRLEQLAESGSATQRQLEQAQAEASRAIAARNAARAELAVARAAVRSFGKSVGDQPAAYLLQAPVSGSVLTIHQKSAGYINAGEPIMEIGNTDSLEIRVEVLSEDAVRLAPGMQVVLEQWGGDKPLKATVSRIEKQGHEEVSALGVKEQRVQVIAKLQSPHQQWDQLGAGYRVLARFIVWRKADVLQVPTSALFRTDNGWAVFVVKGEQADRKKVKVGRQSGLTAQVLEGLSEGDVVITHPGSKIKDGVKVEPQ